MVAVRAIYMCICSCMFAAREGFHANASDSYFHWQDTTDITRMMMQQDAGSRTEGC